MPSHGEEIEKCARSRRHVYFAPARVDPRDGNLADHEARAPRQKENLDVEPKSIELLQRKQQLCCARAEQLEPALRVVDSPEHEHLHRPIEYTPNRMT